jgi:hypothetical protein
MCGFRSMGWYFLRVFVEVSYKFAERKCAISAHFEGIKIRCQHAE